jgi:hypothetical protein
VTADDDDDGLKSLRAVWLSMPDEDPPERGLADLMAAARVKAETMATPPLWQRFVDAMRRPPVLALATVMVLIGGAVLVSNRNKGMDAQPTVSTSQEAPGAARDQAREEGQASSAGSAAATPAHTTTLSPDVVGGSPAAEAPEEAKPTAPPMKRPGPRGGDGAKMKTSPKADAADAPKTGATLDRGAEDSSLLESDGEAENKESKATATDTRPHGGVTAGAQAPMQNDSAALATSAPSSADLHQMARKLVAKGDCKSAQTLTTRIAKQDPAYYKAKVVTDHTFDRCVLAQ